MQKKFLLLGLLFSFSYVLSAQTYRYNFNNDFTEAGGIGPTLTEVLKLDLSCGPLPGPGAFTSQVITTASGTCGSATPKTAFNFDKGGGISFPNSSFITGTYTIHALFKFNTIPGTPPYIRIIDFKNGTTDCGLSVFNADITACQAIIPIVPSPYFTSNVFTLCTVVRDGGTNQVSIYFDGVLTNTLNDVSGEFTPTTPTTPIIFFRDNLGGGDPCEDAAGSVKYISITAATSTALQVSNDWTSLCSSTLPLRMIDFSANSQTDNSVLLKWITDNEENTSRFELERSTPGGSFSRITSITTNNSTTRSNYSFTDRQPLSGTNLYRLKIYDIDGQYKYSNILKVSFGGKQKFEVFPNPAKDIITINGIKGNEVIKLLNTEGKELIQKVATGQSITMDISKYPTGIYIVTYFDGTQTLRQKIVKQ
jgi:Secretion system C-terminal sorting domain